MCENKTPPRIAMYDVVEVQIPAVAVNQVPLPDVANLRDMSNQRITIFDIEVMCDYAYAASFRNQALPGLPFTELPKISLVLYYNNHEYIRWIPLAKLNYTQNGGVGASFQQERTSFADLKDVVWPKSYLQFNAALVGTPYIVPLLITYWKDVIKPN